MKKQRITTAIIFILFVLVFGIFFAPNTYAAAGVSLSFTPSNINYQMGTGSVVELRAHFTGGTDLEKLDYVKVELAFSPNYLRIPDGQYIDTSLSGLKKIINVDGPTVANQTGKIRIELAALTPGDGPNTVTDLTLAAIRFSPVANTPSEQTISITFTDIVNNQSQSLATTTQSHTYTVGASVQPTPTITPPPPSSTSSPLPTNTPAITQSGSNCPHKSSGDANCDGITNMVDFEIWRKEALEGLGSLDADFNGDGVVNSDDFMINFISGYR